MTLQRSQSMARLLGEMQALEPKEISERLKEIIAGWLTAEELEFEEDEGEEEGITWRFIVRVGEDWSVQVVQPAPSPDKIAVGTGTRINEYHQERMQEESVPARRRLNREFRESLYSELLEITFQVESEDDEHPSAGIPQAFTLKRTLFVDGLTKTRFHDALVRVHSARIQGVNTVQAWYGTSDRPLDPVT